MRTLNCKRTARMISLYVAGDLVGAPEREIVEPLAACATCRRLADEFSQSSSLLTEACAPAEFGAEFYSGIRCAVLGEMASHQMPAKPSLFRLRWLYATAFAVIVIVSGVALLHLVSARREPPRDVALVRPVALQPTPGPTEVPLPGKKHELPGERQAPSNSVLALASPHGSYRHVASSKPDALVTARAPRVGDTQSEPAMQSSTRVGPVALEAPSQVSRIANIRIIWLSPRESREPDGTNHDQDRNENSNRK